ncbi:cation:proton antiporter domain-containing protein [Lyngbya aestuarii]|uniref:cation:proton antiporter domain-containing protein n=1 Tax=Lyngbya aestuarii TaxID=118322 RepID=UPI00403D7D87
MEQILRWFPDGPIVVFTILILVSLTIPPWFERLRLPGLVGLLIAGVVLGQNGLGLLDAHSETVKLLSDIGKIYLMFVAGLEIDLAQFRKKKNRALGFGVLTFLIPLLFGTLVGQLFGFGWNASILIGSLFASHTLLGYPIVQRLGLVGNEAVIVTIGATIFTDISALLVLAVCVSIHAGEFSLYSLSVQLGSLAIYSVIVLFGFDWVGKEYFRRTGNDEGNQFLFVLLAVFLASVGAQIIHVEQIVGAFLAGLAVNDVVGRSPVKEKVEFVGSVLFIPFFFIGMGLLLDIPAFIETLTTSSQLTIAIVVGLIGSKFLAALGSKLLYRYSWNETMIMWSLSMPQVAATLAAALVGFQVGLLTKAVFNSVIVLMLVTSIVGPMLTARFAPKLPRPKPSLEASKSLLWWETQEEFIEEDEQFETEQTKFTVVVPVYNPVTEKYLIEIAALLARHESGQIVPLSIAQAHVNMDEPQMKVTLKQSRQLLRRAQTISSEFNVHSKPALRIEDDIACGIIRAAREQNASLIVMGWSENTGLRARLFGNLIDNVFWSSHCPVAVMRLLEEPIKIRRILVPVSNLTQQTIRTVRFAQLLADSNKGSVTLLNVCPPQTSGEQITSLKSDLAKVLSSAGPKVTSEIEVVLGEDVAEVILSTSQAFDIVILRSFRRRTVAGLAVSDVTSEVINSLNCSMVLFGEPHS